MRMRRCVLATLLSLLALAAHAVEIAVVGLFPGKAVLSVNGGNPRAYAVGAMVLPNVKLLSANESGAVLEVSGKQKRIAMGQHAGSGGDSDSGSVTLQADGRGHFIANGQINGGTVQLLVDTGATLISLPAYDAARLGIKYKEGRVVQVRTANGVAAAYMIKLDTVKIGGIVLHQIDALVQERGLHQPLLGMSFLNRTEMRRDGDTMVLKKRF